jgi:hypothetical protein
MAADCSSASQHANNVHTCLHLTPATCCMRPELRAIKLLAYIVLLVCLCATTEAIGARTASYSMLLDFPAMLLTWLVLLVCLLRNHRSNLMAPCST